MWVAKGNVCPRKYKAVNTWANDVLILIKVSMRNGTCLRNRSKIWIIIKQYKITPTLRDNAAFGLLSTESFVFLLNGTVTDTELERTTIWSWRNLKCLVGIFLQGLNKTAKFSFRTAISAPRFETRFTQIPATYLCLYMSAIYSEKHDGF